MIILTGANKDMSMNSHGNVHKNFSFRSVINETVRQSEKFGYTPVVYDLGSLGIGERYYVQDETFESKGYYSAETQKGYKSKSLFKPEIVRDCLLRYKDFTVYLDGDATLYDSIDEVVSDDYDIGVTLRKSTEMDGEWYKEYYEIVKFVNAGVIFFNPTPATFGFVDKWQRMTLELGNDQRALNKLVCPEKCPLPYSTLDISGVRVKYFPGEKYNYYYFDEGLEGNIKILHFKGPVRHFYPFDWRKRLYCRICVPALNMVWPVVKKFIS